jgi:hypothetical protein
MSKFTYTAADLTVAQYAIDTLTGTVALEDDIARGIGVLRDLVSQGAIIADLVAITGRSKSAIGRITGIVTLSTMLESDLPGDGILRTNKAVNAANKVKGLNLTKKHINVWAKDGRRFGSWNAIADAVEAVIAAADPTVGTDEDEAPVEKTYAEKIALLAARIEKIARDHGMTAGAVLTDVWDIIEKSDAEKADEAADAADLAA